MAKPVPSSLSGTEVYGITDVQTILAFSRKPMLPKAEKGTRSVFSIVRNIDPANVSFNS